MSDKRLFLLDAFALIFRGYYAFIKNPRINSKGLDTSAILGFTNSLLDVIKKEKPSHIAVVFDVGKSASRTTDYPAYKANRDETPEAIKIAVPYIKKILSGFGIPILFSEGFEADDVIGTLAVKAEQHGYITYMVTPDKDFAQLVTENIKIYKPASKGGGPEIWGVEEVNKNFEINNPKQVIDFLGMMGDSVDNIPGLPGVGKKTAQKFIQEYGSLEALLENTHNLKGAIKEKIENNKELGILSKKLATIITDVPIELNEESLLLEKPHWNIINEIFSELEFRTLLKSVQQTFGYEQESNTNLDEKETIKSGLTQTNLFDPIVDEFKNAENNALPSSTPIKSKETVSTFYQSITDQMGRKILIEKLLKQKEVCFDTKTTGLNDMTSELVGISFSYEKNKGYYIPLPEDFNETLEIINEFKPFFESKEILKIGQNLKFDIKILHQYKIEVLEPLFDTMIAHYLINPDMRHSMDYLSEIYLNYKPISIESLIGKKGKNQNNFRSVPIDQQTQYATEDADITLQLKSVFEPLLKQKNVEKIFNDIEMPLLSVLVKMELEGINLDKKLLKNYSKKLELELSKLEKDIYLYADEDFNINSPKQLGVILFEKLKLVEKPKKTKTGQYATSEEILTTLKNKHEIISSLLEYRQLHKLKSTYVDALPLEVNKQTNRIHTGFAQTIAATGRLSSVKPNLQNIPIRTIQGQEVRKAFVPKNEDYLLLSADYSQIELRLIAEMSHEKTMIDSFNNGEDIHAATASKVFDVELDKITREQRSQAKTINFGIIYGVSAFGLSQQTGLSRQESKALIDAYYETYPSLKNFINTQTEFAKEFGFVETLFGRRRYLNDINSSNSLVRSHAERNAVNAPIQGSAADIIKIAMIKTSDILESYQSKMLLQVHDELVFDVHKNEIEILKPIIKSTMENVVALSVPLIVEIGVGKNWLEAH